MLNPGVFAVLDTAVPELWLPHYVCDQIASDLNLTYHDDSGRYILTAAAHSALQSLNGSLEFRIGTGLHSNPAITIEIPYKAFDLEATWPIFNTTTRYFPLRRTANKTQYMLGRVFLQEAYLVVDWERDIFELSQAVFSNPMPEPNIITVQPNNNQTSAPADQQNKLKLSAGAIAGFVIGVVIVAIAIAFGFWFWQRKRKQEKANRHPGTFQALQGHGRRGPSELAFQVKVELYGHRSPVAEMYVPPKPHELAYSTGENTRAEMFAPVVHEMGDDSVNRRC